MEEFEFNTMKKSWLYFNHCSRIWEIYCWKLLMSGTNTYDLVLDATGLYCPEPVMLLHKEVRALASGQLLFVSATDPSTTRDIPKFCQFLGHELVEMNNKNEVFEFVIKIQKD